MNMKIEAGYTSQHGLYEQEDRLDMPHSLPGHYEDETEAG
jgi:hypothetical protein